MMQCWNAAMGVHVCTTWRLWVNWGLAFLILPLVPLLMGAFEEETRCVQWLAWVAWHIYYFNFCYISAAFCRKRKCSGMNGMDKTWCVGSYIIYIVHSGGSKTIICIAESHVPAAYLILCREPELYACMPDGPRYEIHRQQHQER